MLCGSNSKRETFSRIKTWRKCQKKSESRKGYSESFRGFKGKGLCGLLQDNSPYKEVATNIEHNELQKF